MLGSFAFTNTTGFPIFSTVELGLAGTSDGEGFTVPNDSTLDFYSNESGVAVLAAQIGTQVYLERIAAAEAGANTNAASITATNGEVDSLLEDTNALDSRITILEATTTSGLSPREAVDVATTSDVVLTGEQEIDGVTTVTSRVLVRAQTDSTENGVYITSAGSWVRSTDMDEAGEFESSYVKVLDGVTQEGYTYFTPLSCHHCWC